MESPSSTCITDSNKEIIDFNAHDVYFDTLIDYPSISQSISFNHYRPRGDLSDLTFSLDMQNQSSLIVANLELDN